YLRGPDCGDAAATPLSAVVVIAGEDEGARHEGVGEAVELAHRGFEPVGLGALGLDPGARLVAEGPDAGVDAGDARGELAGTEAVLDDAPIFAIGAVVVAPAVGAQLPGHGTPPRRVMGDGG